jgi:hypothetical protein
MEAHAKKVVDPKLYDNDPLSPGGLFEKMTPVIQRSSLIRETVWHTAARQMIQPLAVRGNTRLQLF